MKKPPCKDCPDRHLACHDNCDKYKEWLEKQHAKKPKNNYYCRSSATSKLYVKKRNSTYRGKQFGWMKDKY